ncbi:hypothetical protein [Catellatospora methionotrophica]|uniref:hypothetical protein n=1 Tax=Catellatospora methionotrophica TaxID=121620 RepID=UPI0033DD8D5D
MAARTLVRVAAEIGRVPVSTYDTVLTETRARRATSCMVANSHLPDQRWNNADPSSKRFD